MATKKKAAEPKPPVVEVLDPQQNMINFDSKAARTALGLNQTEFWQHVFVTQSGGSRYENDRSVPKPVQSLLVMAYGTDEEAAAMVKYLRNNPKVMKV